MPTLDLPLPYVLQLLPPEHERRGISRRAWLPVRVPLCPSGALGHENDGEEDCETCKADEERPPLPPEPGYPEWIELGVVGEAEA